MARWNHFNLSICLSKEFGMFSFVHGDNERRLQYTIHTFQSIDTFLSALRDTSGAQQYPEKKKPSDTYLGQLARDTTGGLLLLLLPCCGFIAAACFSLQERMIGYAVMANWVVGGTGAGLCPGRCVGNGLASVNLFDGRGNALRRGESEWLED